MSAGTPAPIPVSWFPGKGRSRCSQVSGDTNGYQPGLLWGQRRWYNTVHSTQKANQHTASNAPKENTIISSLSLHSLPIQKIISYKSSQYSKPGQGKISHHKFRRTESNTIHKKMEKLCFFPLVQRKLFQHFFLHSSLLTKV